MNPQNQAESLLDKYLKGHCTQQEINLVERFYLDTLFADDMPIPEPREGLKKAIWGRIALGTYQKRSFKLWPLIGVAASIVLVGFYLFITHAGTSGTTVPEQEFFAAANKATLTLADGRVVELNGKKSGVIVNGKSMTYSDGSLVSDEQLGQDAHQGSNLLLAATPKGGTYMLTLPDGSKVWLNADSKIKFPSHFDSRGSRTVNLDGEAYFEVTHDQLHPFVVNTPKQSIQVLGTHFNVNAYGNEPAERTVLLEGAVRINNKAVLKPGEESIVSSENNVRIVNADLETEMAWKNGVFVFNDASLDVIMRQVARWYNIEVVYQGDQTNETYNGTIDRNANLSRILNILKKGGVKFEIKGNTLLVTP